MKKKNGIDKNKLTKINDALYKELERLDNDDYMKDNHKQEVQRSTALQRTAQTILNSVRTNLDIIKTSEKALIGITELNDFLGIKDE